MVLLDSQIIHKRVQKLIVNFAMFYTKVAKIHCLARAKLRYRIDVKKINPRQTKKRK